MSDLVKRLRFNSTAGVPDFTNSKLLEEAADRVDTMETMLQAMADGRIVMLARIEALEADFNSESRSRFGRIQRLLGAASRRLRSIRKLCPVRARMRKIAELEYLTDECPHAENSAGRSALLVQKESRRNYTMTDIEAAANIETPRAACVERIEALEKALRERRQHSR